MTTTIQLIPLSKYPGYAAGSNGYIYRTAGGAPHARASYPTRDGFLQVKDLLGDNPLVHLAIAEAFLGPKPPGYDCVHKNKILSDNRPDNLEYVPQATRLANTNFLKGSSNGNSSLNEADVWDMKLRLFHGESITNVAAAYGVHRSTAKRIASGVTWKHVIYVPGQPCEWVTLEAALKVG